VVTYSYELPLPRVDWSILAEWLMPIARNAILDALTGRAKLQSFMCT